MKDVFDVKKISRCFNGSAAFINGFAYSRLDLYGIEDKRAQEIIAHASPILNQYFDFLKSHQMRLMHKKLTKEDGQALESLLKAMEKLKKAIKKKYNFLYVNFDTIFDPEFDDYFTTIEVIPGNHPERMRFLNSPIQNIKKIHKKKSKPDLIDEMMIYMNKAILLIQKGELLSKEPECEVFHCVFGFTHKNLKPYLKVFNEGAFTQKELILKTIKEDKDIERRAAAIFLVGHFTNAKEIIDILMPYVTDKMSLIRNNAMRVILMTMEKAKIANLDVSPFIELLDSPYVSDRNKALYILLEAVNSPDLKRVVKERSTMKLILLLQSKQPNNHLPAYEILKKIANHNFSENDIVSWKKWFAKDLVT